MIRRLLLVVPMVVVTLWLGAAPAGAAPLNCALNEPDGWTVIPEASSEAQGSDFLCNYKVRRDGKLSGTAITIEYFCTPAEASERWRSVAANKRKTETDRIDGQLLVIQEGPAAENPDNPQSRGVTSQYFDDQFALFEKEWRLLNPQVFATIVVLTNQTGKGEDKARYGVAQAEPFARTLADVNRGGATCQVPPVSGGAKGSGKSPIVTVVAAGGGIAIAIGGIVVWRRRKLPFAPPPPPDTTAGSVPPTCAGLAANFDDENAKRALLDEALTDLRRQVERAERIHQNNIIKAKLVVGIEIASAFAGPALDLAIALRRNHLQKIFGQADGGALGQLDNWKPPSALGAKMTALLEQAEAAAHAAFARFRALAAEAEEMAASIARRVDDLPLVREARENFQAAGRRLREMEHELAECERIQALRPQLEAESRALTEQNLAWHDRIKQAERTYLDANTQVVRNGNVLGLAETYERAVADLAAKVAKEEDTVRLGSLTMQLKEYEGKLAREVADPAVRQARAARPALEEAAKTARAQMEQITSLGENAMHDLATQIDSLQAKIEEGKVLLHQNEFRTAEHVDAQRQILARAGEHANDVRAQGFEQFAGELAAKQNTAQLAEAEYKRALQQLEDLRAEASTPRLPADDPSVASQVLSGVGTVLKFPVTILGELVFGVGQSPEEIMEILRVGRTNVLVLHSRIEAVAAALDKSIERTDWLRRQLEACTKANTAAVARAASTGSAR